MLIFCVDFRIQQAEPEYKKAFQDELDGFKDRVTKRAKQKMEELIKEAEEEERQERLGPGGLDPIEVMESLPEVCSVILHMEDCFMFSWRMIETSTKIQKPIHVVNWLDITKQIIKNLFFFFLPNRNYRNALRVRILSFFRRL